MLPARHYSAGLFLPGGRGAALFHSVSPGARGHLSPTPATYALAVAPADRTRHLSALHREYANLFHLRRYALADRPRLSVPVPPRVPSAQMAMDGARRHSL